MTNKITKKEIMIRFKKVYSLRFETGYKISRFIDPDYYTWGTYGWNCDVFIIGNLALTYGDRPFGKEYSKEKQQELLKKLNKLDSRYDKGSIKFNTMMEKGREIIKEFFLAQLYIKLDDIYKGTNIQT